MVHYLIYSLGSYSYTLYSSMCPGFQKYLEQLTALTVQFPKQTAMPRQLVYTWANWICSPCVHPVIGFKSIYVTQICFSQCMSAFVSMMRCPSPGFTRCIIGCHSGLSVPPNWWKSWLSSMFPLGAKLSWITEWVVLLSDLQINDNLITQIVTHSTTFDFWPATQHAPRATPHGGKPQFVEDCECKTSCKVTTDRQIKHLKEQY